MSQETLWAPWRLSYIVAAKPQEPAGCFLCRYASEPASDAENFVVSRGRKVFVVLNRYPYNNGHLLVAPYAHKPDLADLDGDELAECGEWLQQMTARLKSLIQPQGFNVGLNLGQVAGAGLPGHMHWHIVPRWSGDTNFMPVLAGINVIPQSLQELYSLLTRALAD